MAAALEFPRHDPHGAPIPTVAGDIESTGLSTLADARPGARLRIRAVRDEDSAHLRSMAAEGLVPGARVLVAKSQRVDGVVEFRLGTGKESRSVEGSLARQIYVVPDE
jgi:DtxR family Mn-dependent transcriptional regulator